MKIKFKIGFLFFYCFLLFISCNMNFNLMSIANQTIDIPEVIRSSILPYQINVDLTSDVTLTFKNSMNSYSVEHSIMFLQNGTNPVPYQLIWSHQNQILKIVPHQLLSKNAVYLIRIQNEAINNNGFKFIKNYELYFTTIDRDIFPPEILGTYPDASVNRFVGNQNIVIMFNEPMNQEKTNHAFSLTDIDDNAVNGTVSWNGNNFIFTPQKELTPFSKYTIKLTEEACDLQNNKLQTGLILPITVYGEVQFLQYIGKQTNTSKYYVKTPQDIAVYKKNDIQYLFVTDCGNNRIIKYRYIPINNSPGELVFIKSWGNLGTNEKEFSNPYGIAVSNDGYVYVTDQINNRVQVFDVEGNYINQWGHLGQREGDFFSPNGIAVDPEGFVYVADSNNNRIQKFNPGGSGGYQIKIYKSATTQHTVCPYTEINPLTTPYHVSVEMNIAVQYLACGIGLIFNYIDENNYDRIAINTELKYQIKKITNGNNSQTIVDWTKSSAINKPDQKNLIDLYQYTDHLDLYINTVKIDSFSSIQLPTTPVKILILAESYGSYNETCNFTKFMLYKLTQDSLAHINEELIYSDNFTDPKNWIQKITSDSIFCYKTFIKEWGNVYDSSNKSGDGELNFPTGITIDNNGYIYVTDSVNKRIQKFDQEGNFISKWGNQNPDTVSVNNGEFAYPEEIAYDPNGFIYVSDKRNHRIQKFDLNGSFLAKWGKNGGSCTDLPYNGSEDGEYNKPIGIAVDSDGFVYIADSLNNRIQKLDQNGNFILKFGYQNNIDITNIGFGRYSYPSGIAFSPDGSLFITDTFNNLIQKFDSNGIFTYQWGRNENNGDENDLDGNLNSPKGIVLGKDDSIYVVDSGHHCIQKFDDDYHFVSRWGTSNGFPGINDGEFFVPTGIAIGPDEAIYVTDSMNHRIQKFNKEGVFITKWGKNNGNVTFNEEEFPDNFGDGNGEFNTPYAINISPDGFIYVADGYNNRIQVFNQDGVFITKFGKAGNNDGEFNFPSSIDFDSEGCIYVADQLNKRIQKFTAKGTFIKKWNSSGINNFIFNSLNCLAIGPDGKIYIADSGDNTIKTFRIISY